VCRGNSLSGGSGLFLVDFSLPGRVPHRPDARLPSFVIGQNCGIIATEKRNVTVIPRTST
jgi:N-formylglutamate amidohydrolase